MVWVIIMISIDYYESVLGSIMLAAKEDYLIGLWFKNQKYFPYNFGELCVNKNSSVIKDTKKWLDIYFQGKNPDFSIPVKFNATSFRESVWKILKDIPYGQTITYSDIAQALSKKYGIKKMSCQAVGGAVGHNPVSIIVPCHRVIGKDRSLKDYAAGIDKKIALLELEGITDLKY